MRKLIITEEEKKSILGLHGILEQTTSGTTNVVVKSKPKPMYGTPEQRATALQKRKDNRQKIFDDFLKNAYIKNFYDVVDDSEYVKGCTDPKADETPYIEGTSPNTPDYVYRELKDGKKIKINLKKFKKEIKNQNNQDWDDYVDNVYSGGLYTSKDLKKIEKSGGVEKPSFYFLRSLNPFKEKDGCIYTGEDKSGVKKD